MIGKRNHTAVTQLLCLLLSLILILSFVASTGYSSAYAASSSSIQAEIDDLNDQKNEIQDLMDNIQTEIDSLDYEKANTLEKKLILDQKNMLAQEELDVIQEQIDIIDGMLSSIQNDLAAARAEEEYQKERWLTRVRAMEENSDVGYMEVLFQATSFADLLTRIDIINEVMAYDEALEEEYIAARENVEALEGQAEAMYAQNEENRLELEIKTAQLDTDIDAACQLIVQLESDIDEYNTVLDQEAETKAELETLIVEKERELTEAKAAEEAARQAALAAQIGYTSSPSVPQTGGSTSGAWMMWPTYTKYLTSTYGPRTNPVTGIFTTHDGVDIGASYGTSIWTAAGGTVVYAGWNGGYGNCVMINHGNGYTTLYGHMSQIAVSNGQTVSMGQVVGYVGSTGNSTGPHLHFEIRASSTAQTLDPMGFIYLT